MKLLNMLFKITSVLLVVVVIAAIVFVSTFDANNYKAEITEQVENATGRTFSIKGDIGLSVFPWIGFKIENATLGNAEGFKAENFASIQKLDIKIHLLPLLKKEVEVKKLFLHGLDLSLEVAKDKSNNWSSLAQSDEEKVTDLPEEKIDSEVSATPPMSFLKIKGFEFTDSVIHYEDNSTNTIATLSALNLETGEIQFDESTDIDFSARVESNAPLIDTQLKASAILTFNKEFNKFTLRDFLFTVLAKKNDFLPQEETIEIKAEVDVSMDDQQVTLRQVEVNALGITTVADLTVTQFLETPLIQGDVQIKSFNAKDVAKRMAIELPEMAGKDALQSVALKTKLKMQGEKIEADNFSLALDGKTLSGWLHILNVSKQQIRYDLSFDALNLDDYMPPNIETAEKIKSEEGSADTAAQMTSGDEKIVMPNEMLRKLDIQGDLRIATLTAKTFAISELQMSTQAKNGLFHIKPLTMNILDGTINTAVTVDVRNTVPRYAVNLNANQVQIGPVANPFLKDAMGDKPAEVDGAVDVKVDVQAAGETINQLKKSSKGPISIDMRKTSVNNFDPEFYMRSSLTNYFSAKGLDLSAKLMADYKPNDVTVFDTIHGIFNMSQGTIQTNDFLMDSDRVQVGAEGSVDVMKNSMNVLSSVQLPKEKTGTTGEGIASSSPEKTLSETLYVRVKGPFDALQYKLDTERLRKSISNAVKNKAKAKLEAEKQKAKAKVDAEKERVKEKAKQKVQEKTKELENKLKDKFKGLF